MREDARRGAGGANASPGEVGMSPVVFRWICGATMVASACGAAVGAVRCFGPEALIHLFAPLGRAPLFVGTVGAHAAYLGVQAIPGGRAPIWFNRPPNDGWATALAIALLCAFFAVFPVEPGRPLDLFVSTPFLMLTAFFMVDRVRRIQPLLTPTE